MKQAGQKKAKAFHSFESGRMVMIPEDKFIKMRNRIVKFARIHRANGITFNYWTKRLEDLDAWNPEFKGVGVIEQAKEYIPKDLNIEKDKAINNSLELLRELEADLMKLKQGK